MFGMMIIGGTLSDGGAGGDAGSGGGGGTFTSTTTTTTTSGGTGGYVASGDSGAGAIGVSSYGPWGEGVYTPLDWPATRFVRDNERLDDLAGAPVVAGISLRTLAIVGLLLWAIK